MAFFSIIIPTYNRAHIINRAIESVLNQTFHDFEIVVVDDGSTDDTQTVIQNIQDKRVHYFKKENQGVCIARNFGSDQAKGKFITFLDSDDYVKEEWLQDFYNEIQSKKVDVVVCMREFEKGTEVNNFSFLAGSFAINKEVFFEIGKYDEILRFGENTELKWRIDEGKYPIATINKMNLVYDTSFGDGSVNRENKIAFFYYVIEKHKGMIAKNKRWGQLLYQIAGVNCFHIGRKKEGKKLIWIGYFKYPTNFKSFVRALKYSFIW